MKIVFSRFRIAAPARQLLAAVILSLVGIAWQSDGLAADDKLVMNMRDADIRSLIQWVADITGKNLVVHKDVQGKVTVLSAEPLTPAQAYQVFLATLEVHGFAAIDADGVIKIVPRSMASASSPPLGRSGGGETVVSVIRAHSVPVAQLANNLRPLVPADGMLTAYPETNSLIISSSANNVQRINDIVRTLDQGGKLQFETIRLEHANAQDVEKSLTQLIPGLAGSDGYRFVNVSVDTRTNTILLGGEPANRRQVRSLIASLDQEVMGGNTDVIYLQYVQADEMLAILKGIGDALQAGSSEQAAGGSGSKISIEASKSTNALVVNAPPAIVSKMRSIVEQVDIRRAQVMIEALVVEVTDDDVRDLGVSWIYSGGDRFGDDGTNVAVTTLGPNLKLGDVVGPDGRIIRAAGGLTLGYFDNGDIKALVRALATSTKANILSTPTIVALDNEEAELLVGQNVPFKTGESTGAASSTENPFTTIERQDIGINLIIKAQINRGDSITLDLKQSTETIAPSITVASDIVTNKRLIRTKALIKDGQTLVVGGLLRDDESEQRTKVPILGDIPLLGKLFGSTSKTHGKTNLMVFIHPTILKDDLQVAEITRQRYDFMRQQQTNVMKPAMPFEKQEAPSLPDFETITPRQ